MYEEPLTGRPYDCTKHVNKFTFVNVDRVNTPIYLVSRDETELLLWPVRGLFARNSDD